MDHWAGLNLGRDLILTIFELFQNFSILLYLPLKVGFSFDVATEVILDPGFGFRPWFFEFRLANHTASDLMRVLKIY